MTTCSLCKLPHAGVVDGQPHDAAYCVGAQSAAMETLLGLIGDRGACRGCHAPIVWVKHANGKRVPYTLAGLNHFIDCPKAPEFKR